MEALHQLKKVLEKEIETISQKNDITPTELERLDKAVDIIKDIETICAMKDYSDSDGYDNNSYSSRRYPSYMRDDGMSGRRGTGYYMDQPYDMWDRPIDNGSSYRRGRDMYPGRDMRPYYYEDANKDDIRSNLRNMMNNAKNDKERQTIQQFLDQWRD